MTDKDMLEQAARAAVVEWKDLPEQVREVMRELGNFSPTVRPEQGLIKGYVQGADGDDGRVYWDSVDLRGVATACNAVADWLDELKAIASQEAK